MQKFDFKAIEKKWQEKWETSDYAQAKNDPKKEKKYILDMFPYPSWAGLHMWHMENYTATDIYSRYLRMKWFDVLHPMWRDAFWLPAENYAIKTWIHPQVQTPENIATFKRQIKSLGFAYDWSREIDTSVPEYYKWTQWFFLFLYENGLAYKKKAKVNWCNSCKTVLANEQAEWWICERCQNEVIQKDLEQWFFKITDFAEDLIDWLDNIDWPSSTVAAQKNWIGKSEWVEFDIKIKNSAEIIKVYTTRIDTVFGMTYVVISPENPLVEKLKSQINNWSSVEKYIKETSKKTELERTQLSKEKTWEILDWIVAINPFNNEEVKVFIWDYVLANYWTWAVMAVPAHDERDFEFAKKYNLPIIQSIAPLFWNTAPEAKVRPEKKTITRDISYSVIYNPKTDKYLVLELLTWETWQSFVVGWIEKWEDPIEASLREVYEETWYKNLKYIKQTSWEIHAYFFAIHKDENRYSKAKTYYFELIDEERDNVDEKESERQRPIWIKKEEVSIKFHNQKFAWELFKNWESAYTEDWVLVNSWEFDWLSSEDARTKLWELVEKKWFWTRKINYKLRDWLISRQRYWWAPIPIIYCDSCGEVKVPLKDLPVMLPTDVDFKPTWESPLVNSVSFHEVNCPICGKKARRESDTMDTFVCSSWYYLRYSDPHNGDIFASKENIDKWLPVDMYMWWAEHTVLHLLYARFFTKALQKYWYVKFNEPFSKLRHQWTVLAEDGRKMSKSLGNVVNPDSVSEVYWADTTRLYSMFLGALEDMKPWNSQNIIWTKRFLDKVWSLQVKISKNAQVKNEIEVLLNKTIKKVEEDILSLGYNTAISALMILVNALDKEEQVPQSVFETLLKILSPFAPFISEELWEIIWNKDSVHKENWPTYDSSKLIDSSVKIAIQVNWKVRDEIEINFDEDEQEVKKIALVRENIVKHIDWKEIKKIVYVKNKLLSIVV